MPAYLIARIEITDPVKFEEYRALVPAIVAQYGGRYVIRGGEPEIIEGRRFFQRLTVLEFDTMEAAKAFYTSPEYAPVLAIRLASTNSDAVLIPGIA